MNFLQSTSSLRRLCDYYVSPAPCKPLSGGARPLDGSSGTGPLMNQSQPKHLLERRDKDGSLRNQRRSGDSFSNYIVYYRIPTLVHPLKSHRRKAVLINGAVYRGKIVLFAPTPFPLG